MDVLLALQTQHIKNRIYSSTLCPPLGCASDVEFIHVSAGPGIYKVHCESSENIHSKWNEKRRKERMKNIYVWEKNSKMGSWRQQRREEERRKRWVDRRVRGYFCLVPPHQGASDAPTTLKGELEHFSILCRLTPLPFQCFLNCFQLDSQRFVSLMRKGT